MFYSNNYYLNKIMINFLLDFYFSNLEFKYMYYVNITVQGITRKIRKLLWLNKIINKNIQTY